MKTGLKIGYIRVSTIDQNEARQLEGLQLDKVFIDKCSAGTLDRPGLDQVREFAREGDQVYIHSLDRLGRNVDQVKKIIDFFLEKKVVVVFVRENITVDQNTTGLSAFILTMLSAFAEFERAIIRERQAEGIRIAKSRGKYKGRKPVITPEMADQINFMVNCGQKITDICRHYNISRNTFYRYANKKLPKFYIPKLTEGGAIA